MDKSEFDVENLFANVRGFLSVNEAELLYRLASEVPSNGVIVEIGSYQGRSTICLGLGAKRVNARVYAIDPHENLKIDDNISYGMENHAALLRNLTEFGLAKIVRVVALSSQDMRDVWSNIIDLGWIDGSHDYDSVILDLAWLNENISPNGRIAIHDSSGHFPGVTQALNEFLAANKEWIVAQIVDATTVLERSHV